MLSIKLRYKLYLSFSIPTPGFPHFYYMLGANLGLLLYGEVSMIPVGITFICVCKSKIVRAVKIIWLPSKFLQLNISNIRRNRLKGQCYRGLKTTTLQIWDNRNPIRTASFKRNRFVRMSKKTSKRDFYALNSSDLCWWKTRLSFYCCLKVLLQISENVEFWLKCYLSRSFSTPRSRLCEINTIKHLIRIT